MLELKPLKLSAPARGAPLPQRRAVRGSARRRRGRFVNVRLRGVGVRPTTDAPVARASARPGGVRRPWLVAPVPRLLARPVHLRGGHRALRRRVLGLRPVHGEVLPSARAVPVRQQVRALRAPAPLLAALPLERHPHRRPMRPLVGAVARLRVAALLRRAPRLGGRVLAERRAGRASPRRMRLRPARRAARVLAQPLATLRVGRSPRTGAQLTTNQSEG